MAGTVRRISLKSKDIQWVFLTRKCSFDIALLLLKNIDKSFLMLAFFMNKELLLAYSVKIKIAYNLLIIRYLV